MAQAGFELVTLLLEAPRFWDYKLGSPYLVWECTVDGMFWERFSEKVKWETWRLRSEP